MTTKSEFKLHVALIQKIEGCSPQEATFRAWKEGPEGLQKRFGQYDLGLDEESEETAKK